MQVAAGGSAAQRWRSSFGPLRIKSLADSSLFNSFFVVMVVFLVIFASGDNLQECDRLGSRKKEMQKVNIKTAGRAAIA